MDEKTRTPADEVQFEQKPTNMQEGEKAMAQYELEALAVRAKMEKLRALRLERPADTPVPSAVTAICVGEGYDKLNGGRA